MLSVSKPMGGAQASQYHKADDYYLQEGGNWQGRAAATLGLYGKIESADFDAVLSGVDPGTGIQLRETKGDNNRAAIDLTFSAPKSVSILSIFDENMKQAHDQAVSTIIEYLEENNIQTREQNKGVREIVNTKNLVAAKFDHLTSRELDPQLHTHTVLMNLTQKADGQWRALHNDSVYRDQIYLGVLYRNSLAHNLLSRGYKLEVTDRKQNFFQVEGVKPDLIDRFSTRRKQVLERFEELKKSGEYSNASISELMSIATLGSRAAKEKGVDKEELKGNWLNIIGNDKKALEQIGKDAQSRVSLNLQGDKTYLGGSDLNLSSLLIQAVKTKTSSEAVFYKKDILSETVKISLGNFKTEEINTAFSSALDKGNIVELGSNRGVAVYSSQEMIEMEKEIIALVKQSKGKHNPLYREKEVAGMLDEKETSQGWNFTAGQRAAVIASVAGKDLVTVIQGDAGTGKTTYAREIKNINELRGGQVFGVGFTGKSAGELRNVGVDSFTIDSFLNKTIRFIDQDSNSFTSACGRQVNDKDGGINNPTTIDIPVGSTFIMDEASMTGNRHFYNLLNVAREGDLKIIIQGDNKQLSSISAGRMHDILQGMDSVEKVVLQDVLRQRQGGSAYNVVQAFQKGGMGAALDEAKTGGNLTIFQSKKDGMKEVSRLAAENNENLLVLVDTNKDRHRLNFQIRSRLIRSGEVEEKGVELGVRSVVSLSSSAATAANNYEVGQDVIVTKNINKNIKAGDGGKILKIDEGKNSIFIQQGKISQEINVGCHGKKLSLFDSLDREFAKGDKIVFLKNDNLLNVVNGSMGEIIKVEDSGNMAVVLSNGNEVSFQVDGKNSEPGKMNYNYIDHAYAVTIHKAQGATTDRSIYFHDANNHMASANSIYVSLTRASEESKIFTNDEEKLYKQASEWDKKTSTLDYENKALPKSDNEDSKDELTNEYVSSDKEKALELEHEIEDEINIGGIEEGVGQFEMEIDFG